PLPQGGAVLEVGLRPTRFVHSQSAFLHPAGLRAFRPRATGTSRSVHPAGGVAAMACPRSIWPQGGCGLPLQRPRRIFRSNSIAAAPRQLSRLSPAMLAGVLGALLGAAAVMMLMPSALFGRAPTPSGTVTADAPEVAVVDGHTLRLQQTVVRLNGVS